MLISSLELNNFKVFYGRNAIAFPSGKGAEVVLIHGHNGHGKSTIMESLFWVLYGKERRHERLVPADPLRVLNTYARSNKEFEVGVTLAFEHDDHDYLIRRTLRSRRRRGAPTKRSHFVEETHLYLDGQEQADVEGTLTEVFPSDIATFFFFDGETISRFAESYAENRQTIEKAIGLPYLKRAREDTDVVVRGLQRQQRDAARDATVSQLEGQLQEGRTQHTEVESQRAVSKRLHEALAAEADRLQHQLEQFDDLRKLNDRLRELEDFGAELDREEEALREQEARFRSALPYLLLGPPLREVVERIDQLKAQSVKDQINRGRLLDQRNFLGRLLHSNTCLCGDPFDADSHARISQMYAKVEEQLGQVIPLETDRPGFGSADMLSAVTAVRGVDPVAASVPKLQARRRYISENRSRVETALEQQRAALASHQTANAREKEVFDRLARITADKAVARARIEEQGDLCRQLERKVADLEVTLEQAVARFASTTSALATRIEVGSHALEAFDDIIEASVEQKRSQIQRKGSTLFRTITNKPQEFQGLEIQPEDFDVLVRREGSKRVATKALSDGERHVVAISILGGLKDSSGHGTLLMDSPFGRLDQTHKKRLITRLEQLSDKVVLLVTDEDLNEQETATVPSVSRRYLLEHDQEHGYSYIVDHPGGGS